MVASPRPGVWLDEAATISATSRSWGELWHLTQHQDRPLVGFYASTKMLADLFSCDPLTAGRLLSSAAYFGAVAIVTAMSNVLWGRRAGLVAGLALALLPAAVASAVNARPEAVSVFLVAATWLAAMRRRRVPEVILGVAACSVYALNVLYLPAAFLVPCLRGRRPTRSDVVAAGLMSALGAAWLGVCAAQQRQVSWIHTSFAADVFASLVRVGVSAPTSHTGERLVTSASVLLGVVMTAVALRMLWRQDTRGVSTAIVGLWLGAPLIACVAVLAGKDVFVERYFSPSVIGLSLLVAYAACRTGATTFRHVALLGSLALLCVPSFLSSHASDGHWGEDIGRHHVALREVTPATVAFAAPRNRAALFARGHLDEPWDDADWWRSARRDGTLWGPGQHARSTTTRVVVDTRRAASFVGLPGCRFAERRTLEHEARFTTLAVHCGR